LQLTSGVSNQGHYEVDGKAMADGLRAALKEAKIEAREIGIIGLAANGVDEEEVFGPQWQQIPRLPLRYFVGEFGSGGLLTAATILLSLAEGTVPPTVQGPELTGLAGKSQRFAPVKKKPLVAGMAIGSTFGGGSACLVFGR
jgi:3-oxoacyl-[acyl-carrier-protein] synthase II